MIDKDELIGALFVRLRELIEDKGAEDPYVLGFSDCVRIIDDLE